MKKVILATTLMFALLLSSLTNLSAKQYKVGITALVDFSIFNVAESKGFWKKQGLDVKVIVFRSSTDYVKAIIGKKVDYSGLALASVPGINMIGANLAIVGIFGNDTRVINLYTTKDMAGKSLKGKTVGVFSKSTASTFFLAKYLKTVDTEFSELKRMVVLSNQDLASNLGGRLNVIFTYGPVSLKNKDIAVRFTDFDSIETIYPIVVNRDILKQIPKNDLKKFHRGWINAIMWAGDSSNYNELKDIVNNVTFKGNPRTDAQIKRIFQKKKYATKERLLRINTTTFDSIFMDIKTTLDESNSLPKKGLAMFTPKEIVANKALIEILKKY